MAGPTKLPRGPVIDFKKLKRENTPPPDNSSPPLSPARPDSPTGLSRNPLATTYNSSMPPLRSIVRPPGESFSSAPSPSARKVGFKAEPEGYKRPIVNADGATIEYHPEMLKQFKPKTAGVALDLNQLNKKLSGYSEDKSSVKDESKTPFDPSAKLKFSPEEQKQMKLEALRNGSENDKNTVANMEATRLDHVPDWANVDIPMPEGQTKPAPASPTAPKAATPPASAGAALSAFLDSGPARTEQPVAARGSSFLQKNAMVIDTPDFPKPPASNTEKSTASEPLTPSVQSMTLDDLENMLRVPKTIDSRVDTPATEPSFLEQNGHAVDLKDNTNLDLHDLERMLREK
jgi:hypothetical protein